MDGMMSIDGSLYDDEIQLKPPSITISSAPSGSLYLDLYSSEKQAPRPFRQESPKALSAAHAQRILATPDARSFALSTPDVEQILTASTCATTTAITTTNVQTPSRFLQHTGPITAEQEMYAQGFIDALDQLQRVDDEVKPAVTDTTTHGQSTSLASTMGPSVIHHTHSYGAAAAQDASSSLSRCKYEATGPNPSLASAAPTYVTATLDYIDVPASQTDMPAYSGAAHPNQYPGGVGAAYHGLVFPQAHVHAAQVPASGGHGEGYPLVGYNAATVGTASNAAAVFAHPTNFSGAAAVNSDLFREIVPADMDIQERMKMDRKKARNRIAASKCRQRRLQRESDLSTKVQLLREHNVELNSEVNGLREQIMNLKRALQEHIQSGCQVTLPEVLRSELQSTSSE